MSAVSERIGSLIKSTGLSMRELSRKIGVSNVSLSQWASGRNEPSKEGLAAFCSYFGVTPAYVLYGDGDSSLGQTIALDGDVFAIPLLRIEASCGGGSYVEEPAALVRLVHVSGEFIRRYCASANASSLQIICVRGDSMEPTLSSGDTVVIDRSDTTPRSEGLYAVRLGDGVFVKRLQMLPSGIRLLSDNSLYPPVDVKAGEPLEVIGKCYAGFCLKSFMR